MNNEDIIAIVKKANGLEDRTSRELVGIYHYVKDMLEDYSSEFHDNIHWDVVGYYQDLNEGEEIDRNTLISNITHFVNIFNAYEGISYTYC